MRKALNNIKHNWKVLAILGVFVAIIFFLNWLFDYYGQNIALMWLAIFIAAIATIAALESLKATRVSLKLTRDALALTRATTRPFLSLKDANIEPEILVRLIIKNTGTLPAENGKFKVTIIPIREPDRPEIIHEGEIPLIFPNDLQTVYFPTDKGIVTEPKPTPDFLSLFNSGIEVHFRLEM